MKIGTLIGALSATGVFVAACAVSQGAFTLTKPGGPFAVGTRSVQLESETPEDSGTFTVTLWYPATVSGDRAPYGQAGGGIKGAILRHVLYQNAARNAPMAPGDQHFPVLVYVASWDGVGTENTSLAQYLASHGFIVIALDDVSRDAHAPSAAVGPLDLSSDSALHATQSLASRKLALGSQRVSSVLDRAFSDDSPFGAQLRARMDPLRVGAIGYSFGGAVAFESAQRDRRIGAVINLDGWLFRDPDVAPARRVPYLFVGTDDPPTTKADLSSVDPEHRATSILNANDERFAADQSNSGAAVFITIRGSEHLSFRDDIGYAILHRTKRAVSPKQMLRMLGGYTVPFLQRALKLGSGGATGSKVSGTRMFLADSDAACDGVYLSES